ncbi:MAG: glycosyltransferase [Gammaproteobacteria bacterium]
MRPLRVLTWHTHGSYLYYLTHVPHEFHVVSRPGRPAGYGGRAGQFTWGDNVFDIPADEVRDREFDCVLYQDDHQYHEDRFSMLSPAQRALPAIYLEHDPPRAHPTDTRHPVDDPNVLVVHVTPFNALMWDTGRSPTRVIEHGVPEHPHAAYNGCLERGLVVINNLAQRGRRLGADLYNTVRREIPLHLVGMAADGEDGLGEVAHARLPHFMGHYRFFFHPVRYTSLGLAVIEAMMIGIPVVCFATAEMATVIESGKSGFISNRADTLMEGMRALLRNPQLAREQGVNARAYARERFSMARFVNDWDAALRHVTSRGPPRRVG